MYSKERIWAYMANLYTGSPGSPEIVTAPFLNDEGIVYVPQEAGISLDGLRQLFIENGNPSLHDAVMNAPVERNIKDKDGKSIDLIRVGSGLAIRRFYYGEAVQHIAPRGTFDERLWQFHRMFDGAGIPVVPSFLLEEYADKPVIVTEYVGELNESNTVVGRSTEDKVDLAYRLGRLLTSNPNYLPVREAFDPVDGLAVHPAVDLICQIDTDPYVRPLKDVRSGEQNDKLAFEGTSGTFLRKMAENFHEWNRGLLERKAMAIAFKESVKDALGPNPSLLVLDGYSYIESMSRGFNPLADEDYKNQFNVLGYRRSLKAEE